MSQGQRQLGMARGDGPHVVLLPRDPEVAYLYWEWPPGRGDESDEAEVRLIVENSDGTTEVAERFTISDACGGRFVRFARAGARHRGELSWGEEVERSPWFAAPRREPGEDSAAFVRVAWTSEGLAVEPAEHVDPTHGRFPAAKFGGPGSHFLRRRDR